VFQGYILVLINSSLKFRRIHRLKINLGIGKLDHGENDLEYLYENLIQNKYQTSSQNHALL